MSDIALTTKVPVELITDLIRVEIVKALGDQQALVDAVVKAALTEKEKSYDRETLFQKQVALMIRQEAQSVFQEYLNEQRPLIRAAVVKRLRAEKQFAEVVADKLTEGLASSFSVSVSLRVADDR